MDNQLQSVSKIFTEKIYRIPDYQRGYAWTKKQLKEFWSDVRLLEDGKNHYVGVLTLEKVPKDTFTKWQDDEWVITSKSFEPFYVVDGQQRLSTIIILIQAITEVVDENQTLNYSTLNEIRKRYIFDSKDKGISRSYIFGYEKDNPSYEFLKTRVFNEQSTDGYTKEETIYTNNLFFAKDFFIENLKELSFEEIEVIFKKVTQNLLFNIYSITSDIDVFIAFETMNNRGKPLSNLELLKNRLIYLSTKFNAEEYEKIELRKRINTTWKAVYHYLGKNKDNILHDDLFLMNHFMIFIGGELDLDEYLGGGRRSRWFFREYYAKFLLENKFSLKILYDKKLTIQDIDNYIASLKKSVEIWFSIHNPMLSSDYDDEEKLLLERLYRMGLDQFEPLLLSYYLKKSTRNIRVKFLKTLEKFGFCNLWRLGAYYLDPHFSDRKAIELARGIISVSELERFFSDAIVAIQNSDFWEEATKKIKNDGFYSWNGIRYFLFEYDFHLKEISKTKRLKINWEQFSAEKEDYITVEHIYPQKATDPCWKNEFNIYSVRERAALVNSLGNLLPLSKPKNSSLQNGCFSKKVDNDINKVGYRYGSYSENEVSKLPAWTPKDILERGLRLLDFMEARWGIIIGDE
ncbi:DUF262 domain-containing HNH endonuclease family protein [Chitinophaga sancti]|uniref:DUF262 domain-containing protein n=1 Tax=Chitinophaga sancti TaxID=1004 RepID=UPI002A758609|nr:DUF262 domain-containing HNH endonuclease family protein [Chitinophaga sancti]WPQ63312.1 DUF262 domain-containing HNH endonuclease family protein [Chitinophaga sancti]